MTKLHCMWSCMFSAFQTLIAHASSAAVLLCIAAQRERPLQVRWGTRAAQPYRGDVTNPDCGERNATSFVTFFNEYWAWRGYVGLGKAYMWFFYPKWNNDYPYFMWHPGDVRGPGSREDERGQPGWGKSGQCQSAELQRALVEQGVGKPVYKRRPM